VRGRYAVVVLEVGREEREGRVVERRRVERGGGEGRRVELRVLAVGGGGERRRPNDVARRREFGGRKGADGRDDAQAQDGALGLAEPDLVGALGRGRADLEGVALRAGEGEVRERDGAERGGEVGGEADEVVEGLDREAREEVVLGLEEGLRGRQASENARLFVKRVEADAQVAWRRRARRRTRPWPA